MITPQQFSDAVSDFEGLINDGVDVATAVQQAAELHGIDPVVFETRLTRDIDLAARVEKVRSDAAYQRFLAAAKVEVGLCRGNPAAYAKSVLDTEAKILKIQANLEGELSRALTAHEVWKIGELLDPFGTHLRMTKGKDPEMTRILLLRQLEIKI